MSKYYPFFSLIDEESLKNLIVSVVRETKWTPEIIDSLFFDDIDYHGILWWYEDVKTMNEEIKKSMNKK